MSKLKYLISCALAAVVALSGTAVTKQVLPEPDMTRADYRVVPLPENISGVKGADFKLTEACLINYPTGNRDMERNAALLSEYIDEMTGMHLATRPTLSAKDRTDNITLIIDNKLDGDEAYSVTVTPRGIEIAGKTAAGVFYGMQTLRKALPIGKDRTSVALPAAQIASSPRFIYRGMHLDCSRHFFGIETVKHYIDMMALHGMNRLHWHLTDDQGWRIEIKKYPRLAEVGGWRNSTVLGHNSPVYDGVRYGGCYTQEEIRDIVKYAADRYITIIPEIDMPGHMLGALAAYPELGCTGGPYEVGCSWGVFDDILCMGKDETLQFVYDVLDEVMQMFPGEYIHIGGDESPRVRWENCPLCQQRIRDLGIKAVGKQSAEARLQGWFTTQVQNYLSRHGRRIIGWDELLDCDVDASATIMSWTGAEPGAKGAKLGHDVIMTPNTPMYFDHYQTKSYWNEPTSFGGCATLKMVYDFEPVAADLPTDKRHHILGAQANLWTEYVTCEAQINYQVLPRMAALAELQWLQPEMKNYPDFKQRLMRLVEIYKLNGWNYRYRSMVLEDENKED